MATTTAAPGQPLLGIPPGCAAGGGGGTAALLAQPFIIAGTKLSDVTPTGGVKSVLGKYCPMLRSSHR